MKLKLLFGKKNKKTEDKTILCFKIPYQTLAPIFIYLNFSKPAISFMFSKAFQHLKMKLLIIFTARNSTIARKDVITHSRKALFHTFISNIQQSTNLVTV